MFHYVKNVISMDFVILLLFWKDIEDKATNKIIIINPEKIKCTKRNIIFQCIFMKIIGNVLNGTFFRNKMVGPKNILFLTIS